LYTAGRAGLRTCGEPACEDSSRQTSFVVDDFALIVE
jgi:hypothetical protein